MTTDGGSSAERMEEAISSCSKPHGRNWIDCTVQILKTCLLPHLWAVLSDKVEHLVGLFQPALRNHAPGAAHLP